MAPLPESGSALLPQRSRVSSGTGITVSVLLGFCIWQGVRIELHEPLTQFTNSRGTVIPRMFQPSPEPFRVGRHGSNAHARGKGQYRLYFRDSTVKRPVQQMRDPRADPYLGPVRGNLRRARGPGSIGRRGCLQHRARIA
jgi:hypothetical protein